MSATLSSPAPSSPGRRHGVEICEALKCRAPPVGVGSCQYNLTGHAVAGVRHEVVRDLTPVLRDTFFHDRDVKAVFIGCTSGSDAKAALKSVFATKSSECPWINQLVLLHRTSIRDTARTVEKDLVDLFRYNAKCFNERGDGATATTGANDAGPGYFVYAAVCNSAASHVKPPG